MLPRKNRLPIDTSRRFPKAITTPYFLIKSAPNHLWVNRFGIVISNAAVRQSIRRHFWKRRIVAALRSWPNLGRDMLIIASNRLQAATVREVYAALAAALTQLKHL